MSEDKTGSKVENTSEHPTTHSNVVELGYLNRKFDGWTNTNEDHLLLLEGLKGIQKPGGFFSVGEYQVLDIALQLNATAVVLGDLDPMAVKKNLEILKIVASSEKVEQVLPRIFELIKEIDGEHEVEDIKRKLTNTGSNTGARIRLSWATDEADFRKLKSMIESGNIAVAQVDITDPESMKKIGDFFMSRGTKLESAYLSNITRFQTEEETRKEHGKIVDALLKAGGHDSTLIIRSGSTTNPEVVQKLNADFRGIGIPEIHSDYIKNTSEERAAHYGHKIQKLPENIERSYTGNVFQYAFEFFTQELKDYREHVKYKP